MKLLSQFITFFFYKLKIGKFPTVEWIQTAAQTSITELRSINAAILLISSTFGYQNMEYQEKAMMLFTQTVRNCVIGG